MTSGPTSVLGGTSATSTATATSGTSQEQVAKVAKQFEAVFLRQMIGSMRQAGLSDELFDSSASDQFRDMADARLADDMAGKGFGIAELLTRQFGKTAASGTPSTAAGNTASGKSGA